MLAVCPHSVSKFCIYIGMIEFWIRKTAVRISFTFFAACALFLSTNGGFGIATLCACGIHELSHLIMMTAFRVNADEILFYGAGICISSREINRAEKIPRIMILSAGCIGNLISAVILLIFGNNIAAAINIFTAVLNILPVGSLDGAQILKYVTVSRCKPENVDKVMFYAGIISVVLMVTAVLIFGGFSFSSAVILLYIAVISLVKA